MLSKWIVCLVLAAGVTGLAAQSAHSAGSSDVRVVQLSLVSGGVEMQLPDGHGWRPALLDAPVTAQEQVRTEGQGRAEIQFENGSTLRLVPNSSVSFDTLQLEANGTRQTRVSLRSGEAFLSLYDKHDGEDFTLAIPSGEITANGGKGSMRVNLELPGGQAGVTVFSGKAEVAYQQSHFEVKEAEELTLGGNASPAVKKLSSIDANDTYTRWSRDRDQWYETAFYAGQQNAPPLSVDAYRSWYGALGAGPIAPMYTLGGLTYVGQSSCDWALMGGTPFMDPSLGLPMGYSSWCWTPDYGWYNPVGGIALIANQPIVPVAPLHPAANPLGHGPQLRPRGAPRSLPAPQMAPSLSFANAEHIYGRQRAAEIEMQTRARPAERTSPMFNARNGIGQRNATMGGRVGGNLGDGPSGPAFGGGASSSGPPAMRSAAPATGGASRGGGGAAAGGHGGRG